MLQTGPEGTQKPTRQRSSLGPLGNKQEVWTRSLQHSKCHEYQPLPVTGNEDKEWIFTDIAVPADQNIAKTQNEQVDRYQELTLGVKLIQQASKVSGVPIFVRALETISKDARTWHEKLGLPDIIVSAQPSAILGTAYVLKKVMCLSYGY